MTMHLPHIYIQNPNGEGCWKCGGIRHNLDAHPVQYKMDHEIERLHNFEVKYEKEENLDAGSHSGSGIY